MTALTRPHTRRPKNLGTVIGISLILLIWLLPTVGLLVTSFRPLSLINSTGWWTVFNVNNGPAAAQHPDPQASYGEKLAHRLTINNYVDALTGYRGTTNYLDDCGDGSKPLGMNCNLSDLMNPRGMGRAFVNSLIVTIPSTIMPIFVALFAAYAFAWLDFKGRYAIFAILVGLQVVPLQMTLVPILRMFAGMGLNGTFLGVWLFHTGFGLPYAIYLLRNSMSALPKDLFESAYLDGATHWQVFKQIVLPLTMPAIASWQFSSSFGLERLAGFAHLPGRQQARDDLPNQQHGHLHGRRLAFAHGGSFPLDDAADDRLLRAAKVFCARHDGRRGQGLEIFERGSKPLSGDSLTAVPQP